MSTAESPISKTGPVNNESPARQRRVRQEQQRILHATEELLGEQRYRDLNTRLVMTRCDKERTSFYRYFPDLETVILTLFKERYMELLEALGVWVDGQKAEADIPQMMHLIRDWYDRQAHIVRAMIDARAMNPQVEAGYQRLEQITIRLVATKLKRNSEAGISDIQNPEETARVLIQMLERPFSEIEDPEVLANLEREFARNWYIAIYGTLPEEAPEPGQPSDLIHH